MQSNADGLIELFHRAKALPAGPERERFLHEACPADAELKEQALSLLEADECVGDFLVLQPTRRPHTSLAEKPGDKLGQYKLLQQIGEGGCGVVYMAEQQEPVRRQVALKVIKLGMDTSQVIARFEAERQALALMDHPNIAKVLDAGATESGRPFFVMELVRGVKITDYCHKKKVSTTERLKLFIQVCHAIQHAHQKGIIHRDIKPSNILVTVSEPSAAGCPKVIDFGIAKATSGQRLTDQTLFTAFEQFIGTPAYMSPEQAMMTAQEVDTRTDIYSLGVLLYELLTGRTPFDQKELLASGLDEIRRTIREEEPVKPSTRLTQDLATAEAMLNTKSETDGASLRRLLKEVRGDLDWIVMKALEKDRTHRYETANALALDISRHLHNEPVVARAPSPLYRFQKAIQRNQLAFAASAVVAVALVSGLCVATWGLVREHAARKDAEAAGNRARAESERNEQVARFFANSGILGMYRGQDTKLVHSILDELSGRVSTELKSQRAAQGDIWVFLGKNYAAIDDIPAAITNLEFAVDAYRTAFMDDHFTMAQALIQLGRLQMSHQNLSAGKTNVLRAVAIARKAGDLETLATCLLDAAAALKDAGEPAANAIPLLREARGLRKEVVPNFLAQIESTRMLAKALASKGEHLEAKALAQEALNLAPSDEDLQTFLQMLNIEAAEANNDQAKQ